VQVGLSISLASFSVTRTESRVPCPVTAPAANLPSGDNTKGNADDTSTNKGPWYSDFVEGGEIAQNIARDAYDAVTWKSIWRFTMDRLPFLEWMQTYTLVRFIKDAQAGFVVATLVIPQVRNKEPCKGHDDRKVRIFRRNTDHVVAHVSPLCALWQGMSYADIAGLPLVAGLYADFAPLIIYSFFGSSRQIAVGPVAIISLLVFQAIPLCNKLCAESKGVNASVPVRFKRKM
jgi:Sulfate permease family